MDFNEAQTENKKGKYTKGQKILQMTELYVNKFGDGLVYCYSWNNFLKYNGNYYDIYNKKQMERDIFKFVRKEFPDYALMPSTLENIFSLIQTLIERQVSDLELAHNYFAFEEQLLNTDTLEWEEFDREKLVFKYLPYKKEDLEGHMPNFKKYLQTSLVDPDEKTDNALIFLYQEMLGALFSSQKEARKVFFLKGDGDNGKSITTELLLNIFDGKFISAASLQSLTSDNFGKSALVGKLLNICSEEESTRVKNDTFKCLVTGELIQTQRKFESSFEFHNHAKFIFATNSSPQFSSLEYAMKKRMIIIPFYKRFKREEMDTKLLEKLHAELASIVGWGLKGLARLQKNKFEFTNSKYAVEEFSELELTMSSAINFFNTFYKIDTNSTYRWIPSDDMYPSYAEWCKNNGYQKMNVINFGKTLSSIDGVKKNRVNGKNYYYHISKRDLKGRDGDGEYKDLDQIKF